MLRKYHDLGPLINQADEIIQNIAQQYKKDGVTVVYPVDLPQRGVGILAMLSKLGVKVALTGGPVGAQISKHVPQYGIEGLLPEGKDIFSPEACRTIIGVIPDEVLAGRVAIIPYEGNLGWGQYIKERGLGTEIVATGEQDLRGYLEEKANLPTILSRAGLDGHIIPSELVSSNTEIPRLVQIYNQLKNQDGKIVVQETGAAFKNLAGKATEFPATLEDFIKSVTSGDQSVLYKVSKFINGVESNLSFFAGNTVASKTAEFGAQKNTLARLDMMAPLSLSEIIKRAGALGIDEGSIVAVAGRSSCIVIGDPVLGSKGASGVGNDLGYVFEPKIRRKISEIGDKLSTLSALTGYVGLAGCDMIIDKNDHIWINELNYRQQAPTAYICEDAEKNGAPSLMKMMLISSFADFKDPNVVGFMKSLNKARGSIHEKYSSGPGRFYMTFNMAKEAVVKNPLSPGIHSMSKGGDGCWALDSEGFLPEDVKMELSPNPKSGKIQIAIAGVDARPGMVVDKDAQVARFVATRTNPSCPPFIVKNGKTVINPDWYGPIHGLYTHLFGPGYYACPCNAVGKVLASQDKVHGG